MGQEVTTWAIRSEEDRKRLHKIIDGRKLPFTADLHNGAPRSIEQNRLQRLWLKEAEEQGDQTAEEYRGYCKLHFGVPILRRDSEQFAEIYDEVIRPRDYSDKLRMMMLPFDMAVTRIMTSKQKTEYLNMIKTHFEGLGFKLTQPGSIAWEE